MTKLDRLETWQERYDRISRKWVRLGKRARRICDEGYGHKMGPLHRHSSYDKVDATRTMRCKRCHFYCWVKLSGDVSGIPIYETCAVMLERKRRYGG